MGAMRPFRCLPPAQMVATVAGANAKATIMVMLTIAATLTPTTNALLGRYLRNETPPGFERPGVSGLGSH